MKKLIQKVSFASLMLFATVIGNAHAVDAASTTDKNPIDMNLVCELIKQMGPTFKILRTLAFVGAAFIIAGWAWGYISKPADLKLEDVKTKGMGMLVGFALLFGIAVIMTIIETPCKTQFALWQ